MKVYHKNIFCGVIFLTLLSLVYIRADTIYLWSNDANGTLCSIATNKTIATYSTSSTLSGGSGVTGLTVDNAGNLYAGCPGQSTIYRFGAAGTLDHSSYPNDSVSGLAFDNQGRLFETIPVYSELSATVYYPGLGYSSGGASSTTVHLSNPAGVAIDSTNGIFVSDASNNLIEKYAHDLTDLGAFASGTATVTGINSPWGIAFDGAGNLFVANSGNSKILKIGRDGTRSVLATSSVGLNAPHGLAFDSAGNLFVANYGAGNILEYATNGVWSVFVSGFTNPASITIYPGLNTWSAMPLKLTSPVLVSKTNLQAGFTSSAGLSFSVLVTTNLTQAWTATNLVSEISPGQYQINDSQATNYTGRFYRVRSP